MTPEELTIALSTIDHSLDHRKGMALRITADPSLVLPLLKTAFSGKDPQYIKACWVLELVAKENLQLLVAHLESFLENVPYLRSESALRPMAKICEYLATAHFVKGSITLDGKHLDLMASICFDWLIGNHKVATKAYAMESLYLLGKQFTWIHPQLGPVLEQNYALGSAAYMARARAVLSKMGN
ncbi:MAG: adenylosuccinate lyase [Sediminicola sp.]